MADPTLLDLMGDTGPAPAPVEVVGTGWGADAYRLLLDCAKTEQFFKAEDVRRYAHARGLEIPPDGRAWGAVFLRAQREGVISRVGWAKTKNRVAHGRPSTVWQVK